MSKESSSKVVPQWYSALIDWIKKGGGHVHESLELTHDDDGIRGIACRAPIKKGELLIRLPPSLALSGESMPTTYSIKNETRHASSWLKCLGALFKATNDDDSFYRPYFDSLPSDYEHLLQWSNEEEVEIYLKGTTLGSIVEAERCQGTLLQRYNETVRPYLAQNDVCDLSSSCSESDDNKHQEHFRQV
jgi:SET domain-containing protein 6